MAIGDYMTKMTYQWAERKFAEELNLIQQIHRYHVAQSKGKQLTIAHPDPVEFRQFALNRTANIKRAMQLYPPGTPIWQHTPWWHTAMIHIVRGHVIDFNRQLVNLIASGVTTVAKFKQAWVKTNGSTRDQGSWPDVVTNDYVGKTRQKQCSYIVADQSVPKKTSRLPTTTVAVDRTHLIPFSVTGVENNPGLLIDFDAWLNRNPMEEFERTMQAHAKLGDVYWITLVLPIHGNLQVRYFIYDEHWLPIQHRFFTDDRWEYIWSYDQDPQYERLVRGWHNGNTGSSC